MYAWLRLASAPRTKLDGGNGGCLKFFCVLPLVFSYPNYAWPHAILGACFAHSALVTIVYDSSFQPPSSSKLDRDSLLMLQETNFARRV